MSTKTKTYVECCDEVAKKYEMKDFADFKKKAGSMVLFSDLEGFSKEVAVLYASEKVKRAIELARAHGPYTDNKYTYTEYEVMDLLNQK